jgi:Fe2+ transport system protein FeoA
MTVMFRKGSVLAAGNYQSCFGFEDYDLWARMLMRGRRLHNLQDVLVYVRCGNGMQRRRGGLTYLREEAALQHRFMKMGFLSKRQFLLNLIARAPVRVAPISLRTAFYRCVLRDASGALRLRVPSSPGVSSEGRSAAAAKAAGHS